MIKKPAACCVKVIPVSEYLLIMQMQNSEIGILR